MTPPMPLPTRRRLLRGALLAAVPYALLPDPPAGAQTQAVDYRPAEWQPATSANYTAADRPASHPVDLVVVHVTQTDFAKTLAVFQNPKKRVSAHYVVRSADGHVAQCVRESDIAWHAGNWDHNTRSVGIEHEGWVDRPASFTDALYERSARLTASVCERHGIPRDRAHIIGHYEVPGTDHTDPGPHWDWGRYMRLVNGL
ncbi:N-acetylmuramoyl-L-alanine amidase [Streptomyces sp. NBC_00582]|uniref:N-acetylmuramoyl-L-alanine amidase n=1 Tax=Streptomyces sp. NBC_00582 TaxID=2975783 RepID=UPI0010D1A536|nr:N-acetylmuramoyl-L-alanine amidase [Streptomyces sp. NBC_00582]WUB66448.1 N-acetylmuramoyl-L-alanine amidase [Streptomyces sp. NBC_00582]